MLLRRSYLIALLSFMITFGFMEKGFGISSVPLSEEPEGPWFTGPLLTPSARVMPKGHINLEPYLFWNVTTGVYDNDWKARSVPTFNRIDAQLQVKYGLGCGFDLSITPQSVLSFSRGETNSSFGDLPVGLEYQIFEGKPKDWITFAKISISEVFPTGKFQNLDPTLDATEISGQGSFITVVGMTFSKLVELPKDKFFGYRWNVSALFFAPTRLHGLSIFGGDPETRGTIHHGNSYLFVAGAEYTVTREFSLACDFLARYVAKKHFKGKTIIPIFQPESFHFSLAPAVEYNWNSSMGIIVGAWFTMAGRNTVRFINGVAAFNYVF